MSIRKAATVLIINNGLFLGVSRKDNHSSFGLPGGKFEEDESYEKAAIRETLEETGVIIKDLEPVFERSDGEFNTVTFMPNEIDISNMESKEGAIVKWCSREELESGIFGEYNKRLFEKLSKV